MSLVVPAVLPSSREDFLEKLAHLVRIPTVTRVQIDVVDGMFATPASWPYTAPPELSEMHAQGWMLPELDRVAYEIDLMCLDALDAAEIWLALGATRLTFHAESALDLNRLLAAARDRYGHFVTFGLALNIASDLALIEPCLAEIKYVQFMGIATIGRQGQPFDWRVMKKIRLFRSRHPDIPVQVDGGISLETGRDLAALGVANLVAGSVILRASDPAALIEKFENLEIPFGV